MSENQNCIFHVSTIREYDISGSVTKGTLLSHPLYFLQNGYDKITEMENNTIDIDRNKAAKALLLLHSLPFAYTNNKIKSFFNKSDVSNVGFEVVPYGFLVLLGGLLYRKEIYTKQNIDIIITKSVYKSPTIDETFLVKHKKGIGLGIIVKGNTTAQYIKLNQILNNDIDLYVKNKLIALFKNFVIDIGVLLDSMEIKLKEIQDNGVILTPFTYTLFQNFKTQITSNSKTPNEIMKILTNINSITLNNKTYYVDGFTNHYVLGFYNKPHLFFIYREDDVMLQMLLEKLYNHKTGVITSICQKSNVGNNKGFNKTIFQNILNGFSTTLNNLLESYKKEKDNQSVSLSEPKNVADNDIKKSMYIYIKQFWDKWLCGEYNNYKEGDIKPFGVEWFEKQFLFIDSFYNDISCTMKLDCKILSDSYYNALTSDNSQGLAVLTYLANIVEKEGHFCNFFCYPDFINFRQRNDRGILESPNSILADIFKPIPYNQINPITTDNQFVIIRATRAQMVGNSTQFTNDSFDIWSSKEDENNIIPATFLNELQTTDTSEESLRMAYKVPAFGVAYSRQSNSIFKNINVGMDTIQVTDQVIKAICNISELGNKNKRQVSFIGNDLYNIYSAYSYMVTITMMGDMQIQPLMYFQLLNIPMFRGSYMVTEVRHSFTTDGCVTTFKGVKMSRIEAPMPNAWFTISTDDSNGEDEPQNNVEDNCNNSIIV